MLTVYFSLLRDFFKEDEGASAVEYGLILGLIAVAIVAVLLLMKGNLVDLFTSANTGLSTANGGG